MQQIRDLKFGILDSNMGEQAGKGPERRKGANDKKYRENYDQISWSKNPPKKRSKPKSKKSNETWDEWHKRWDKQNSEKVF